MTNLSGMPKTLPVLALKYLHPRNAFGPKQMRRIGYTSIVKHPDLNEMLYECIFYIP